MEGHETALHIFEAGAKAALEYARGQQEPVALNIIRKWPDGFADRLQHVWLDVVSFIPNVKLYDLQRVLAEFGFTMKVYEGTPTAHPSYKEQCQAEGWQAVSKTLDEVMPGWTENAKTGIQAACNAIRELAQPVQPAQKQEPVARGIVSNGLMWIDWRQDKHGLPDGVHNLYTTPPAQPVQTAVNEQMLVELEKINLAACYASEDATEMREALLLEIGKIARAAIAAAEAAKGGV